MKIIITPVIAGKPWNGATIYEAPLGGSESAVIYLAREFSRRGHNVVVYSHGQPGNFEGVEYRPVSVYNPQHTEGFDAHISSRDPRLLDITHAPRKVLWLHDMPQRQEMSVNADKIVCLSTVHAIAWGLRASDGSSSPVLAIEGDGVDTSLFSGFEARNDTDLVWNANPDRGLPVAAVIFQEIRKRWPEMTLHVYGRFAVYGWGEEHERLLLPEDRFMESIILHQPVARLQLARILMRSWAYFYPTFWPETYCCATLEAQAAGTPVITSPVGALPETVKGGIVTQDIINAVSQLRNVRKWRKCSEAGLEYAKTRDWSLVAQRWEEGILQ